MIRKFLQSCWKSISEAWKNYKKMRDRAALLRKQRTFVYCKCGNEMVGDLDEDLTKNLSFVKDAYVQTEDGERNVVHYNCSKCKKDSFFDFDIAPCPIQMEEDSASVKAYCSLQTGQNS